jgi:Tfp pilus assembly protein PilO
MTGNRGKIILAVVASVVVCAAFFMLFVWARQADLAEVRADVQEETNRTEQLQAELEQLQALQANAPKFEARLAEIRELVPQDDQVANLIFQVQEAASRAGVDFVQIDPDFAKAPAEGAQVAQVRATIGAEGGYFALQDFVRRLYDLDRALRLDNISLKAETTETAGEFKIQFDGSARVFFELPKGAAPAPVGTTTTAPTTTTTTP